MHKEYTDNKPWVNYKYNEKNTKLPYTQQSIITARVGQLARSRQTSPWRTQSQTRRYMRNKYPKNQTTLVPTPKLMYTPSLEILQMELAKQNVETIGPQIVRTNIRNIINKQVPGSKCARNSQK